MFKVFEAKITKYYPPAIAILACFVRGTGGDHQGECFLIFQRPFEAKRYFSIEFDDDSFRDSSITLTDQFVFDELAVQASEVVGYHIDEHYMTKAPLLASGSEVVLKQVDESVLIRHHLRDQGDYLKDVMNKTRDAQLKEHLGKVLALQKIVIKNPG